MKQVKLMYAFLFFCFLYSSCTPKLDPECENGGHFSFKLVNNSDERIASYFYSDTILGAYGPNGNWFVEPGESRGEASSVKREHCWEYQLKDGKVWFYFIFNADSVKIIPWDTVRATNRGVLKRYDIDLEYLVDHDYIITYP